MKPVRSAIEDDDTGTWIRGIPCRLSTTVD